MRYESLLHIWAQFDIFLSTRLVGFASNRQPAHLDGSLINGAPKEMSSDEKSFELIPKSVFLLRSQRSCFNINPSIFYYAFVLFTLSPPNKITFRWFLESIRRLLLLE